MSSSRWARARKRSLAVVAGAGMVAATLSTAGAASAAPPAEQPSVSFEDGNYVVILKQAPSTTYDGGVRGFEATKAPRGKSFEHSRASVRKYEEYLQRQQQQLLEGVGATATYSYTTAVNAVAAKLTGSQATELAASKDVLAVTLDEERRLETVTSPEFLGLTGANGDVWNDIDGTDAAGDGVVVGVLDSGYWPENPSFAGDPLPTLKSVSDTNPGPAYTAATAKGGARPTVFHKADGTTFTGACAAGEEFSASSCNSKVISARYYDSGFLSSVKRKNWSDAEYRSARDGDGHGSHTASTAAGNDGVEMSVDGRAFGEGSGMAPAAKLSIYKVCWNDNDPNTGGCYTSDSIAAINQAVKDGVDVINYSISGAQTTVVDAVEYAFLGAAAAGVFVAASAGNSGPTAETVAHNSPWVTTVAASTHVAYEGTVVLGNSAMYKGASINDTRTGPADLVHASSVGLADANPVQVKLCYPGTLDPAKAAGKIVVCDRGENARVDKSLAVAQAGGVGSILANVSPSSLDADFHSVPTVHVDHEAGAAIKDYIATTTAPTATLEPDNLTGEVTPVPQIAGFSSRGPALASDSSVLKPDISAPGVSVLAAVAPPSGFGRDFDLKSGTSMSSPHVAGLAALYLGVHPDWHPSAVKSAMMTTAYDLLDADGDPVADPFAQGAGHVDPTRFFAPGLVVQTTVEDWAAFYTGQGLNLGVDPIDPQDLNYPSIAVGQLPGTETITRTFTAVEKGTYDVTVDLPGFDVTLSDEALTFAAAGETQELTLTLTRTDAPLAEWSTGFVTLSGPQDVRMPVAVRPVSVAAPAEVTGTGAEGSVEVGVTAGFTGDLDVTQGGLAEGVVQSETMATGEALAYITDIAPDTSFARFDLDAANDNADLDLYVYRMNAAGTALVAVAGTSATGSADERVDLLNPQAGKYYVVAEVYETAPGENTSTFTQTDYKVTPATTLGNLTVAPNPVKVKQGEESTFSVSWSDLDDTKPYLGWVGYEGALAPTIVSVN